MSAYINKVGKKYQVIAYNSLWKDKTNAKGTKYVGLYTSKKQAQKVVDEINKEEDKQYAVPQETIEKWADLHQNKEHKLIDISKEFQVPLRYVKKQLKAYSEISDWYDYYHAREHSSKMEKYFVNVNDEVTSSVYRTFIKTMKSLGKSTAEAWLEIYKITGENPPDLQEVENG